MLGWELPPYNSGGLGVACYELCRALSHDGVDIDFILPYRPPVNYDFFNIKSAIPKDLEDIQKAGSAYDSYKYIFKDGHVEYSDLFRLQADYERAIDHIVDCEEYDIIHAHDWLTFRAGIRAKILTGLPLIIQVHATEFDRSGGKAGNSLVHDIEWTAMMMADKIIAVSQFTKNVIVNNYQVPADKIEVIHNSIRIQDEDYPQEYNLYNYLKIMKSLGYGVVTNVGRLTLQKGLVQFVQAAARVIRHRPKTIFLVVGSGDQYEELIRLGAAHGISDKLIFTGFQRGQAWRDAFSIADLFVMPSISEPFGLVALESVCFGTPVLISKQSGVGEVLKSSLRVDYWDIDKMANQIVGALDSNALRKELLEGAKKEVEKMSWGETSEKIRAVYHKHTAGATL